MEAIKTHPNQKVIIPKRNGPVDEKGRTAAPFFVANWNQAIAPAMKELTPNGFKLWMYLNCKPEDKDWALSSVDVQRNTGISPKGYDRAVQELKDKKYLRCCGGNKYFFFEIPIEDEEFTETYLSPRQQVKNLVHAGVASKNIKMYLENLNSESYVF